MEMIPTGILGVQNMLEIQKWVLGQVATNTYLVGDTDSGEAVVIDPAWDGTKIYEEVRKGGWQLKAIWLTHAHFDHFGGLADLLEALGQDRPDDFWVGMHPKETALWKVRGGAVMFGISVKKAPRPEHEFQEGEKLSVGGYEFVVHHAPGHSPGHVIFHCPGEQVLFSGDVIINLGIGRTDLLGGSYPTLMESIQTWVLPLADETRIYSGHGPETTVGAEKESNPFLS
jgi:glyoxylase-like metal-dependent hydrolase (beta-lactamase superfamily II)